MLFNVDASQANVGVSTEKMRLEAVVNPDEQVTLSVSVDKSEIIIKVDGHRVLRMQNIVQLTQEMH